MRRYGIILLLIGLAMLFVQIVASRITLSPPVVTVPFRGSTAGTPSGMAATIPATAVGQTTTIAARSGWATRTGETSFARVFGPNLFSSDGGGTGEWNGEFWPGAGLHRYVSAGVPGDRLQIMWGDWVFRTAGGPFTYTWKGQTYTNPGNRTLPLDESIDRPYLEYMIDKYCGNGEFVVLDEEYIEPWYGTWSARDLIFQYQAKMRLLSWAQSYGHPRGMKFSHFASGPMPVDAWSGYYGGRYTNPGPGYPTWMERWQDKGIEASPYNFHRWCEMQDFYAPNLYMHDNSVEWWNMRLAACLYCLYDAGPWTLPRKPVIPMVSPQVWGPIPLPAAYPPAPPNGTPVSLDVLAKMIADLYDTQRNGLPVFNKVYWYIGASSRSWGDSAVGQGWWQRHPGTLPPQIQLIKDKIR